MLTNRGLRRALVGAVHLLLLLLLSLSIAHAGTVNGPCKIKANMNTLQGMCLSGFHVCLQSMRLSPGGANATIVGLDNFCGHNNSMVTTVDGEFEARVIAKIRDNFSVAAMGSYHSAMSIALLNSDEELVCGATATVTEGECLHSTYHPPNPGPNTSSVSHQTSAIALGISVVAVFLSLADFC